MRKRTFIEDLFSIRKSGIWKGFAQELDAEFIDQGFFKEDKLVIKRKNWIILIDVDSYHANFIFPVTRISAICQEIQPLYFRIISKNNTFFPRFNTIKTKSEIINNKYYIKGSNESILQNLLNEENIKQILLQLNLLSLRYDKSSSLPIEGKIYPVLQHKELGYIRNISKLNSLIDLFILILDHLFLNNIIEKIKYNP